MSYNLKEIRSVILPELEQFEEHFKLAIKSRIPLLDKISLYIIKSKGKQFRPMLSMLCSKMCGEINKNSFTAATMVELLHTATLVHDDVVDDSDQRRGFFSINALWKNKIAVLVGDYLLSKGLLIALQDNQFEMLKILSQAVSDMSEGELLQLEKARRLDITKDIYYQIIRQKTASLIAVSCQCGGISVTNDQNVLMNLQEFGINLGIAFQIKDDLMDLGTSTFLGKPKIQDIREKKMTLPLILALQNAPPSISKDIIGGIRNDSENEKIIRTTVEFIHKYNGVSQATEEMNQYRDKALEQLHNFPENEARESLRKLCYFVTEREN
ncbi:MAG: polyprenyl synthetase family protein [Saprospiraceae bacterium]|nr:polyprenyl synthetase family protein [Saprospiraceae bacterium]